MDSAAQVPTKLCGGCSTSKPVTSEHWYLHRSGRPNGRLCRDCLRARAAPNRIKDPFKLLAFKFATSKIGSELEGRLRAALIAAVLAEAANG